MASFDLQQARFRRTRSFMAVGLLTAVMVALSLLSPVQQTAHAATSSVSGVITGNDRPGVGVPGVQVYLDLGCDFGEFNEDCETQYLTTTDAAGRYAAAIEDRTGPTKIIFSSDQYAQKAVMVNLVAGQTATGQDFVLNFTPYLTFRVLYNDASHTPAASRSIALALGGSAEPRFAQTDANGVIIFRSLPAGNFRIYDTQYPKAFEDRRVIVGTQNVTAPDLIISEPITFTRVTVNVSVAARPVGGVIVTLVGIPPTTTTYTGQSTYSDNGGYVDFQSIAPGSYRLSADGKNSSYVPAGYVPTWWRDSNSAENATPLVVGTEGGHDTYSIALRKASPLTSVRPEITGSAVLGSVLTAVPGTWQPAPVTLTYKWMRNGAAISGATASTYTVTANDVGLPISVTVTGTKPGYASTSQTSASVTPAPGFTKTPVPTISGSTVPGSTLAGTVGSWSPTPDKFTYAWLRNGAAIPGETSRTHRLVTADIGTTVTFSVTAAKAGIPSVTRTSAPTATIAYQFAAGTLPAITGRATVGTQLSASTGSVTPTPTSYTYAWLKNGSAISGATTSKYTPRTSDEGSTLSVRVTATRSGYAPLSQTSTPTVVVRKGFTVTPTPAIIGAAKVGTTLVASTPSWRPLPVQLSFQWKVGGVIVPDTGGTIYKITPADVGKTITLTVSGTKDGYLTESRTSIATRPVVAG